MKEPLISVIVPVYGVEKYLTKCVQSLINQTYKNLEIILVDDGSLDNSGALCDELSKTDTRIKVIHRPNGGLSAARNDGLAIASGELLGFVDSDDYIDNDMYQYLYSLLSKYGADIAVCAFRKFSEESGLLQKENAEEITSYSNKQAMKLLLEDELIGSHPCNKLFKRSAFDGLKFPEGRVYEDIALMHRVFAQADTVVCSTKMKYNYLIRGNSTSYTQTAKWGYSLFKAFKDRCEFICEEYTEFSDIAIEKAIGAALGSFIHWAHFKRDAQIHEWEKEIIGFMRKSRTEIKNCRNISSRRRKDAQLMVLCPDVLRIKYRVYYFLKRRMK